MPMPSVLWGLLWPTEDNMATLQKIKTVFYVRFRLGGEAFRRSLETTDATEADAARKQVELTHPSTASNFDPSIQLSRQFGKVENGSAYDRAALDLGTAKKLVLPDNAVVRRAGEPGQTQLFMKKTPLFYGHPPEPMSIRDARHNMGCAVKVESDAQVVATYGEWDSKEGGAQMRLVAVVPEGVEVEQRKGLSGPNSAAREGHEKYITKPKDAKGGFWYGPASPAEGWAAVPGMADPERTAE